MINLCFFLFPGTGYLNFDSFCKVAANFLENEDDEVLQKELKEAFRLYDKQGEFGGFEAYLIFFYDRKRIYTDFQLEGNLSSSR